MQLLSNSEILLANKALIDRCVYFQSSKFKVYQYAEDIKAEIYIIILEYPNDKLNLIHNENHMNAFVTGILTRQLYSQTSPFYRTYRKFSNLACFEINYIVDD